MSEGLTESDKQTFFERCGIDRATRNVISHALFGIANIGMLATAGFTGGTVPVGVAIAGTCVNGLAHFLKTSKHMDKVSQDNKELKQNVTRLIETQSMSLQNGSSGRSPHLGDDAVPYHSVNTIPPNEVNLPNE